MFRNFHLYFSLNLNSKSKERNFMHRKWTAKCKKIEKQSIRFDMCPKNQISMSKICTFTDYKKL